MFVNTILFVFVFIFASRLSRATAGPTWCISFLSAVMRYRRRTIPDLEFIKAGLEERAMLDSRETN